MSKGKKLVHVSGKESRVHAKITKHMLNEQAQLGLDRPKKLRIGSVWTGQLGLDWLKKPVAGSSLERYSHEGIYFGVSIGAHL